ncbi:MAG: hypothetical protein LBT30_00600 [Clostridiales bacterium]|nr:hypothetical protein [Clostridiales bacterium]
MYFFITAAVSPPYVTEFKKALSPIKRKSLLNITKRRPFKVVKNSCRFPVENRVKQKYGSGILT